MKPKIKNIVVILSMLLVHSTASYCQKSISASHVLKGSYFGQETPGMTSKIFAPGIVSTGMSELNSVFSPDGKKFFFCVRTFKSSSIFMMEEGTDGKDYDIWRSEWKNRSTDILWVDAKVIYDLMKIAVSQFRGEGHSGIYNEKNLLKKWPDEGPRLKWYTEMVGNGYGSPAVTDSQVFVQGERDSVSWVFSFDLSGNLLWKRAIGREFMWGKWTGSHSTPTVAGDLLYVQSTLGDIACLKSANGEKVWTLSLVRDLKGAFDTNGYGYSQSLLVDRDLLYCMPGGKENNISALNRFTGEIRWNSPGTGEEPRCSPVIIDRGGRRILVATSTTSVMGLDLPSGKMLWSHLVDTSGNSHYNTPQFDGENLYCFSFYNGKGVIKLSPSEDGTAVKELWSTKKMLNTIGGVILNGSYLTGTHQKSLVRLDISNGHKTDSMETEGNMGGTVILADSMFYLYDDMGNMSLVDAGSGRLTIVSSFRVPKGTRHHFSNPVIKNGTLYIRHGRALMAYNISK